MMHRRSLSILLATAAALAVVPAMSEASSVSTNKVGITRQDALRFQFRRENMWGGGSGWGNGRRFRHGWSNRHQVRLARKARNQARNRRAHRG